MNHMQNLLSVYPQREARALYMLVMEVAFGLSPTQVLTGKDKELSEDNQILLQNIIGRLLRKEPVQYILGQADFCGHTFHVESGVLIPRPETEGLVRLINLQHPTPCSILDIGTGSGCIAVSLALLGHQVTAFDVSAEALCIARKNARELHADVDFRQEDILHPSHTHQLWDVIVSNPPYICQSEAEQMDSNVLDYEPHMALFVPDDDPLLFYRSIAEYASNHLKPSGHLYFEINEAYPTETASLLEKNDFLQIKVHLDNFRKTRFISAIKK
ncbi:MAG: peptide chain release factor N(5)-glutamine methyltransferase [Bacteroidaceae bacterium]|nr:peptide chain release factor N(5)-glutamine methyltransferase [Bacteroidaceae bacterium]